MKEYLGTCVYKIKGLNTERLVNEFLKNKINILHFEKQNEYMIFKCNYYDSNKVKKLLKNYEILATEYNGICSLFHFIKKRFVLLIGIVFLLFFLAFWQTHLFNYNISGLERIDKNEFISVLNEKGYSIGVSTNKINTNELSQSLISSFSELSFVSVVVIGSSLVINVKEKEYDENLDESLIKPIVASFDGVVNSISVYQGTAMVKSGDIVRKGQVLIAPYIEVNGEVKSMRAKGEVNASIFIKGQVVFNENERAKIRSGNFVTLKSMNFYGSVFKMKQKKVPYSNYEIEKSSKIICKNMPICFRIVEERYYELIDDPVVKDFESQKEMLVKKSRYMAYENLKADFDVISEQTDIVTAGENHYITTYLKVNTNIGVYENESNIWRKKWKSRDFW